MAVQYHTHTFEIPTSTPEDVGLAVNDSTAVTPLAMAAVTEKANLALQPEDIGITVATAAQGALAATAVQPEDLGTSAPLDVGTTAGTVAAGDDERIVGALQPADIGYNIGLLVEREDYQGERAIYTEGGQTVFARKTVDLSQANDWHFLRVQNTAGPDTTFGFVNSNARATTIVNATSDQSEWAFTAICEVNAASANAQHVASYHQAIKNADAKLWSLCTEMRDDVPDPTTGSVGIENGMLVKGTDSNNNRVATHVVIDRKSGETGTSHEVARGVWITADSGNVLVKWGLEIKGKFDVGVDLTGIDLTHSDRAINLQSNMFISWMGAYHGATQQAFFAWNASISAFQMGGMRTVSGSGGTVGAIADHAIIQINGTLRAIPLYAFTP